MPEQMQQKLPSPNVLSIQYIRVYNPVKMAKNEQPAYYQTCQEDRSTDPGDIFLPLTTDSRKKGKMWSSWCQLHIAEN